MMAIKTPWLYPIQTPEFIELRRQNVLEGSGEPRVENYPCKWVPAQIGSQFALIFCELCRTVRRRKWCRKVEMEAGVDSPSSRHRCGPLRILHEYHSAD